VGASWGRRWGFILISSTAAVIVATGAILPTFCTEYLYDRPTEAQQHVDNERIGIASIGFNLGTKVSVFGAVENISNLSDVLTFIPEGSPADISALNIPGFNGTILFVNKIDLREGEVAVVEGHYYRFDYDNTTYALILGSSIWDTGLAIATGLESGAIKPAKVFRPWWDQVALILMVGGGILMAASFFVRLRWPPGDPDPKAKLSSTPSTPGDS
jgi:hypothetical protein